MKFAPIDAWYLAPRDWTGFIGQCPASGLRDEITEISLMVRGKVEKQL